MNQEKVASRVAEGFLKTGQSALQVSTGQESIVVKKGLWDFRDAKDFSGQFKKAFADTKSKSDAIVRILKGTEFEVKRVTDNVVSGNKTIWMTHTIELDKLPDIQAWIRLRGLMRDEGLT